MGMFKMLKDTKKTVAAAPGLVDQAMQLSEQAQAMSAAQAAAAQRAAEVHAAPAVPAAAPAAGPDLEPIAGLSLERYAGLCREIGPGGEALVLAAHGIAPEAWREAMSGWGARMQRNVAVAKRFNQIYTGG